jgi:hypothetical protein
MLLTSFHMWHWILKYDNLKKQKVEWTNYDLLNKIIK